MGRKLSKNEVSHAVHKTRSRKLKGVSSEEVRKRQLDQIGLLEKMSLQRVRRDANGSPKPFDDYANMQVALSHATAHVFERNSVAPERELLHAALVKGCGQIDLADLKTELRRDSDFVACRQRLFHPPDFANRAGADSNNGLRQGRGACAQ